MFVHVENGPVSSCVIAARCWEAACSSCTSSRRSRIVTIEVAEEGEAHEIGGIVNAVNQVFESPPEDIESAPSFGAKLRTECIAGMGRWRAVCCHPGQ
jgi:chemotaxis signal transduction protein